MDPVAVGGLDVPGATRMCKIQNASYQVHAHKHMFTRPDEGAAAFGAEFGGTLVVTRGGVVVVDPAPPS